MIVHNDPKIAVRTPALIAVSDWGDTIKLGLSQLRISTRPSGKSAAA